MGRFSDFERKVDEMAVLSEVERKAVHTWLIGTPGLIVLLWLLGVPPRRETFGECITRKGSGCYPNQRGVNTESIFYIAERDWTPGVQLIGATTVALVLFIAYLRIWKRPDES